MFGPRFGLDCEVTSSKVRAEHLRRGCEVSLADSETTQSIRPYDKQMLCSYGAAQFGHGSAPVLHSSDTVAACWIFCG